MQRTWLGRLSATLFVGVCACTGIATPAEYRPLGEEFCPGEVGETSDHGPVRRLSEAQYANTVRDLGAAFGVSVQVDSPFPDRGLGGTFSTAYLSNTVSRTTAEALMARGESVSEAMTADLPTLLGCAPSDAPDDACAIAFIDRFARAAFRRPVLAEERQILLDLYAGLVPTIGARDSVRAVIEASLQSPLFLYIDGGAELVTEGRQPFEAYALANRLSYFLWDSMPDEALMTAAGDGALGDPVALRAEVDRMLDDPRARPVIRSFHQEWLRLADPAQLRPDAALYPEFTPEVAASVAEESARFVEDLVWQSDGSFTDLLTSRRALLDPATASLYGVTPDAYGDDGWGEAELPADRRGLLTRAHFMSSHRPIFRGTTLIDRLLCRPLEVPANIDTTLQEAPPGEALSPREVFERHSSDPFCRSCHNVIDPIGFSFEHYGADGAYREFYEGGLDIETAGRIESPSVRFENGGELLDELATQQRVHSCYAERFSEWAIGRGLSSEERCAANALSDVGEPTSLRDLIAEIATSDVMRFRGASPEGEEL